MKFVLNTFLFLVLTIGSAQISSAQVPRSAPDTRGTTGIATMFARDPLTQSLCLRDGGPGGSFQGVKNTNRCSDLNFNSYSANGFSVGVEGSREGIIIDLGTPAELKAKYGYTETVGNGQGFASIDVRNGRALILKNYETGDVQELAQSADLFRSPEGWTWSVPVQLGHVYLLRITDRSDKSFELFAKVLVLSYTPSESVTVRWYLMANNTTAKL